MYRCNITGYSLGFGFCAALDTLISQAYGAKLYSNIGLHVQRAIVILSLFAIPVGFIWLSTERILKYSLGFVIEIRIIVVDELNFIYNLHLRNYRNR